MIKDAENLANDIRYVMSNYSDNVDEVYSIIDDANYYLSNVTDDFEKLREAIMDIRAWGQEWKNLAKYLMEQMEITEVLDELYNISEKDYNTILRIVNEKLNI